jgi:hypothetical protein
MSAGGRPVANYSIPRRHVFEALRFHQVQCVLDVLTVSAHGDLSTECCPACKTPLACNVLESQGRLAEAFQDLTGQGGMNDGSGGP